MRTVLVTGAGYIGCLLAPKLLADNRVIDLNALWFGREPFDQVADAKLIGENARDRTKVANVREAENADATIRLATFSNALGSSLDNQLQSRRESQP